jgi:hypothetical protein
MRRFSRIIYKKCNPWSRLIYASGFLFPLWFPLVRWRKSIQRKWLTSGQGNVACLSYICFSFATFLVFGFSARIVGVASSKWGNVMWVRIFGEIYSFMMISSRCCFRHARGLVYTGNDHHARQLIYMGNDYKVPLRSQLFDRHARLLVFYSLFNKSSKSSSELSEIHLRNPIAFMLLKNRPQQFASHGDLQ